MSSFQLTGIRATGSDGSLLLRSYAPAALWVFTVVSVVAALLIALPAVALPLEPPQTSASPAPLPVPPAEPDIGQSIAVAYLGGQPSRLDCGPVHVTYNSSGAPDISAEATAILRSSVEIWADAVGRPVYFSDDSDDSAEPVEEPAFLLVIGWSPDLGPNIAGEGGGVTVHNGVDAIPTIISGRVTLAADTNALFDPAAGPGSWGEILEHELGHVSGLDHADRPGSRLSTPAGTSEAYTSAEIEALAWAGNNPHCDRK